MLTRLIKTFALVVAAFLALQAPASATVLDWEALIDQSVQGFEDPYRDLTFEQVDAVRTVAQARAGLAVDDLSAEQRATLEERLSDAQALLAADGLDADWLISQRWVVAERRKKASTSGNQALDGKQITIAGYTIPAPTEDGVHYVYLVPEFGMCSHMPAPNPNQMIRIRSTKEQLPKRNYMPVNVTGQLKIAPTAEKIFLVDGLRQMSATFALDLDAIEVFGSPAMASTPNHATNRLWKRRLKPKKSE